MSHPDFRTRVHSERPGWYVPYARGGDKEIKFANDKLKSVSFSDDSLDNSVSTDQQTTSKQWTSDHSLSRQEAKLQLRQAGKASERSNDERSHESTEGFSGPPSSHWTAKSDQSRRMVH